MAMNKGPTLSDGDLPEQENVLHRVLQLPVVSGTCECVQKTYNSTKEAHPLVASVCNAYEKGVQGASNLAAWSMEPVVRRLSTQFTAANELACRGLDHLEEKIPALQYPPEKLASELKGTISTRLRSARNSISVPIASTSDKVLASCELALGMAKETVEYAANTRVGRLASGGADLALGGIEKVVEFLLPPAKEESAPTSGRQRDPKTPKAKPSLVRRVSTLANTLSRHTMQTTAWALKQGHSLAMWIPGVAPLSSLAQWGASAALQVVSPRRRQSEVRVPWLHNLAASQDESHDDQTDSEGEESDEEEEEGSEAEESGLGEVTALPNARGLLGGVVHTVQKTLRNTISAVTWAPAAVLGTVGRILHLTPAQAVSSTKGRAMSLSDALKGVTDNVVDTVVHYVPLPRLSLMEPESEFRDIDNPPAEVERKGSGARPASPESAQRPSQPRGGLRSVRGLSAPSCPGLDDKAESSARPGFLAMPREKPARRVSDSFFRPSVMEPILGRAQYNQLRKKS